MADTGAPEKLLIRDADGVVTEEASMKNGVLEGETVLYAAGHVRARLQFHDGKQQGEAIFYDAAGYVQTKAQYADGKRHGEALHYSPTGALMRKATYERGLLQGYAIDYYPSGKPREVSTYKEDVLDGEMIRLSEDGKITERLYYERGRPRPKPHAAPKVASAKLPAVKPPLKRS
jgi:antitoxin component YwqK of YwqJK toxin-antitoxin module